MHIIELSQNVAPKRRKALIDPTEDEADFLLILEERGGAITLGGSINFCRLIA
jgi:hypothetical protein